MEEEEEEEEEEVEEEEEEGGASIPPFFFQHIVTPEYLRTPQIKKTKKKSIRTKMRAQLCYSGSSYPCEYY